MALFWEFFTFELKFRFKSLSTYVYFLIWITFSFLDVASESFGPIGNSNGKILLNGPYANTYNDVGAAIFGIIIIAAIFGIIIIAAIFGTSILRDFQRDTYQMLFTKPISKFAYLGGRWAGSFVTTVFAFSGVIFGTYLGTLAPWADHTRIGPNHLWTYLQPFLSILVVQIFLHEDLRKSHHVKFFEVLQRLVVVVTEDGLHEHAHEHGYGEKDDFDDDDGGETGQPVGGFAHGQCVMNAAEIGFALAPQ
jgi:hypothetical protein